MNQRDTQNAKELEKFYAKKDKDKFLWRLRVINNCKKYNIIT